ncbi:uncharacterized protein LOC124940771 [Impatiens glandulifera]|uniref:uncharacterized protein LOC124940771 n=1 Tax=Impatiens glandulifera TaxID=253017 RepID=UPI001FB19BAE|nr:uncharacterized protein LOC124940771 [Impatiens glandulifera]
MEKKHNSFSALKEEVIRALSPARSQDKTSGRSVSALLRRRRRSRGMKPEPLISRYGTMGETLTPLIEGPDPDGGEYVESKRSGSVGFGQWVKGQLFKSPSVTSNSNSKQRSDLRLLLGVLGAPLAPMHVTIDHILPHLSIKDTPIETSSAQYILQQYIAASGGHKLLSSVRNAYAMGKLKMVSCEFETTKGVMKKQAGGGGKVAELGGFVLWQMNPDMWYVELAVGGSKVQAGCNGDLVWRHTPWLDGHTAKGPVRPLRRALQGLDPRTTAAIFSNAKCIGERNIDGEDCFILKLCADPRTLTARSEGPAEIIRHVMFGYFSQKTGLLIHIEDSHLTRIQTNGSDAVYWETTVNSILDNYRPVDGIMIAHSGHSIVTLYRFGETIMSHTKSRLEEAWTIEEVAFNVPGLSIECFIPPSDIRSGSVSEASELSGDNYRGKNPHHPLLPFAGNRAKVAAVERSNE